MTYDDRLCRLSKEGQSDVQVVKVASKETEQEIERD